MKIYKINDQVEVLFDKESNGFFPISHKAVNLIIKIIAFCSTGIW